MPPSSFFPESFSDAGNAVFPSPESVIKTSRPRNEIELVNVLRDASRERILVTIVGALTGLTGSGVPLESGLRIDMTGLDSLPDHPGYRRIKPFLLISESNPLRGLVAPGVSLQSLNDALKPLELWYPPHPGETRALIGGNVATNASGPRSFAFGSTRAYIESLRVILMDGTILNLHRGRDVAAGKNFSLRAESGIIYSGALPDYLLPRVKNAAGLFAEPDMDLIDLFIGSEGILGCFSEIGLRFLPRREIHSQLFFLPSTEAALDLVDELRTRKAEATRYAVDPHTSGLGILSLEFFDRNSLALAKRAGHPVPGTSQAAIEIEWFSGDAITQNVIERLFQKSGGIGMLSGKDAEDFRYAVPRGVADWLKQHSLPKLGTDFAVPVGSFREMYRFYEQIEREFCPGSTSVRTANWGHIGDGHLHFNFLPENMEDVELARRLYLQLVREAIQLGGTISAEHGVGKKSLADEQGIFRPYLWYLLNDKILHIARTTKIFDPDGLLNRGNMVPVSMLIS